MYKLGMNHPMARSPGLTIGLDVCLHIMEVMHHGLGDDKYRPCPAAAQDGAGVASVGRPARLLRIYGEDSG
ncbi:MAG: 3-hydroxyacyl-CoA dehydrogenase family protein [Candidatus Eisenbacteria bacterium]